MRLKRSVFGLQEYLTFRLSNYSLHVASPLLPHPSALWRRRRRRLYFCAGRGVGAKITFGRAGREGKEGRRDEEFCRHETQKKELYPRGYRPVCVCVGVIVPFGLAENMLQQRNSCGSHNRLETRLRFFLLWKSKNHSTRRPLNAKSNSASNMLRYHTGKETRLGMCAICLWLFRENRLNKFASLLKLIVEKVPPD